MFAMQVTFHGDAGALGDIARDFWLRDEAMNNLVLGLVARMRGTPDGTMGGETVKTFASIRGDSGALVGTAWRTPPNALVVSAMGPSAIEALVPAILAHDPTLDGVMGPTTSCDAFAEAFSRLSGKKYNLIMHEGVYCLETFVEPTWAPGRLRPAAEPDAPLLIEWLRQFGIDAHLPALDIDPEKLVRRYLDTGTMFLWEHEGTPVTMVGSNARTPNGARVGPVYTPSNLRGRGYGTSGTAAVTKQLLDAGQKFCFLFTDLSNQTSNGIYRRIGYRQVGEYRWWGFTA